MRTLAILLFCLIQHLCLGQFAISADPVGGTPLKGNSYKGLKGSPYLYDDWRKGEVGLADGTLYKDIDLIYDLVSNMLVFKDQKGVTKKINDKIDYFILKNNNDNIVKFVYLPALESFVEELVEGHYPLYKKHNKSLVDEPATFGKVDDIKTVLSSISYFIIYKDKPSRIKLSKNNLEKLIGERFNLYNKENKDFDPSEEEDLIKLFVSLNDREKE